MNDATQRTNSRTRLAQHLGHLMDQNRLTVRHMLKLTTLSQKSFSNILRGEHSTGIDTLDHVAQVFDLEGWELLAGGEHLMRARVPAIANQRRRAASGVQAAWPMTQTITRYIEPPAQPYEAKLIANLTLAQPHQPPRRKAG